ncbi:nucleotidyltransferase family protein [Microbacterium sp. B19]|uniref:nucleotidyltransferase family protein n=1 Tax=Microbacterium sp. B19 TaxID=96765 RepID=UPI000346A5F1|nr:nucleotidyltransferase family protein [Microbacterium sp. B19]
MTAAPPSPAGWVAIASGALDVTGVEMFADGAEVLVLPAEPAEPFCLTGEGARMWRRLVDGVVTPTDAAEREMLEAMTALGIASPDPSHPARVAHLAAPRLSSPFHELAYALTARCAAARGIPCVFIKGPALHHQGLRDREHSGDVDVWCPPDRWDELAAALAAWGWSREPDPWRGTSVHHTATMTPGAWGCEIDVHRRVPGLTLADADAFAAVARRSENVVYAGVEASIPRADVHAVLAAVHAVRPEIGAGPRSAAASATAVALLAAADGSGERAIDLGAVPVLADELRGVLPAETIARHREGVPRDWAWRAQPDRVRAYWVALRGETLRTRVRVLGRFVWPTDDVVLASARHAGDSGVSPSTARWHRLARGLRSIRRATL